MEPLGKKIKEKRKKERLSAEDLAVKLGTKKENIYKWEAGATPSDPEVYTRVKNWANGVDPDTNKSEDPYKEKYIKRLERDVSLLEEKIQASLTGISDNIIVSRATLRAAIDYQVMKDSKGDEKKRIVLMEQINKLIHLKLTEGDTVHSSGASDKRHSNS